MKSSFRLFIGTATLCLTVLLGGCGQPGPLYLPKPPGAKPAKSAPPAGVSPAPAPAATGTVPGVPATSVPVSPSPVPSTLPASQQ